MITLTNTQTEQAIELLRDAQEHLREAVEALDSYYRLTQDEGTKAYIRNHLRIMIDEDHGFLTRDRNLEQVISALEEDDLYDE